MTNTNSVPQHVRIEAYIRDDESNRPWDPQDLAPLHAVRAAGLAEDTRDGDDSRAVEIAVYMYARRSAHWGLVALGETSSRGFDPLPTYYRRA